LDGYLPKHYSYSIASLTTTFLRGIIRTNIISEIIHQNNKNEYRTQNNKCHLTQNGYKGVLAKGVLGKRHIFLLGQKEHILANIGREPILGAPKPPKRNTVSEIQERA
jgi:hypothetical protein